MSGRVFIDTNIFVYANIKSQPAEKHDAVLKLFHSIYGNNEIVISTQVINEISPVLLKNGIPESGIQHICREIINHSSVYPITLDTIDKAWEIKTLHSLSYWDSLIVASAIEHNCSVLYSEDMQHEQTIEGSIQIINPLITFR